MSKIIGKFFRILTIIFAIFLFSLISGQACKVRAFVDGKDINWNTFFGSTADDYVLAMKTDGEGNVYVTGRTNGTWGNPIRAYTSGFDGYVAKFNKDGVLVWNTFLGGVTDDNLTAITIDSERNVYIEGYSSSTWGSPIRAYSGGSDIVVTKLDSTGNLLWNTFLGGSVTEQAGYFLTVDSIGAIYLSGFSYSTWGNPVRPYSAGADGFIAKLDGSGNLMWNTYIGGTGVDYVFSGSLTQSGEIYVAGYSSISWGNPINGLSGGYESYIGKIDSSGNLLWHTFYGGLGSDYTYALTLDALNNLIVQGSSNQTWGNPVNSYSGGMDAFIAKFDANGILQWNTFYGSGSVVDYSAYYLATDNTGNIYATGYTSASFGTPIHSLNGGQDAYLVKHDANGNILWNTFIGSSGTDYAFALTRDDNGNIYVGGRSNATWGTPIHAYTGGYDGYIAKIDDKAPVTTNSNISSNWINRDLSVTLTCTDNTFGSGCDKTYYTTDGTNPTSASSNGNSVSFTEEGEHTLKYFSVDSSGNQEAIKTATSIKIDKTAPSGTIVINNGNSETNTRQVTLNLSVTDTLSGVTEMMVSSNPSFEGLNWETYKTSRSFTVTSNSGSKFIFVKYRDAAGNESQTYSDSIVYTAPIYTDSSVTATPTPSVTIVTTTEENHRVITPTITSEQTPLTTIQIFLEKNTTTANNAVITLDGTEFTTNSQGKFDAHITQGTHVLVMSNNGKKLTKTFVLGAQDIGKEYKITVTGNQTWYICQIGIPIALLGIIVVIVVKNRRKSNRDK